MELKLLGGDFRSCLGITAPPTGMLFSQHYRQLLLIFMQMNVVLWQAIVACSHHYISFLTSTICSYDSGISVALYLTWHAWLLKSHEDVHVVYRHLPLPVLLWNLIRRTSEHSYKVHAQMQNSSKRFNTFTFLSDIRYNIVACWQYRHDTVSMRSLSARYCKRSALRNGMGLACTVAYTHARTIIIRSV